MWITNKDPLYTTWNSILCNDLYGKRILQKNRYIDITDSLYCTPETNISSVQSLSRV